MVSMRFYLIIRNSPGKNCSAAEAAGRGPSGKAAARRGAGAEAGKRQAAACFFASFSGFLVAMAGKCAYNTNIYEQDSK